MSAVKIDETTGGSRDILSNGWIAGAVYWLPVLALVVSGFLDIDQFWRTMIWTAALITMGIGCIVNALRCGRVHCYLSGPFFLLMAILILVRGLGAAPIGDRGWNLIGLTALAGALILYFLPEMFLGRYWRRRGTSRS